MQRRHRSERVEREGGGGFDGADLEVGVEVGEADGSAVLERAVRLAPALQRRHCCRPPAAAPRLPGGVVSTLAPRSFCSLSGLAEVLVA